jgi:hypothetical protein
VIAVMRPFNIVLVQPPGYIHTLALWEIGKLLLHSFRSLGIDCRFQINAFEPEAVNVVLGYQVLSDLGLVRSCDCIIYQLEQLSDREGWFQPHHLDLFRRVGAVWDYSPENINFLQAKGIDNVRLLPIGFHEALRTIRKSACPDIDVLFYGSLNPRRQAVLDDLARTNTVQRLFGVYGEERDRFVARSKVVLNVHFYDAQIMEQPRISYLLNNRCFVVSEESKINPFGDGLVIAPYGQLAETCRAWLKNPGDRDQVAQAGFERFRGQPMMDSLREVLPQ